MALVRFQPFVGDFQTLQERANRIFQDSALSQFGREEEGMGSWTPLCDIYEEGDNIVVKAELPGLERDDIDVQVENNILTLRGERKREKEVKSENLFRTERFYGTFTRSFTLPVTVDTEKIRAEYKDGVLLLTMPKVEEAKPRKIKVLTT
jgi:HSP20 family protein